MKETKDITVFIKGITIILMFCNHLFPIPEWIFDSNTVVSFAIGSKTIASYVGGFGKICVSVFALLTGIGLYHIFQRRQYQESNIERIKYSARKIFDILIVYWGILFLFYIPLATVFGVNNYSISELLSNIFLINTSIIQVAWYVRFYVELMITLPILYLLLRETNKYKDGLIFIAIILLHLIAYVFGVNYIEEYFNYLMVVVVGYFYEKYQINKVISNIFCKGILVSIITLLVLVLFRGMFKTIYLFNTDIIFAPIFVGIVYNLYFKVNIKLRFIVSILGKYSLELWFLHAIFFIGSEQLQKIGYWPKIDFLILLWTLCMLLPFAIVYNRLFSCLKSKRKIASTCSKASDVR